MFFAGLDLSSPRRKKKTCLALLDGNLKLVELQCGLDDDGIESLLVSRTCIVLMIDAPLSLPDDTWREEDIKLRELLGEINPLYKRWVMPPLKLRGMESLTRRGISLYELLSPHMIVGETHPRASLLFLLDDKKVVERYKGGGNEVIKRVEESLKNFLRFDRELKTDDEVDAIVAALTAHYYIGNRERVRFLRRDEPVFVILK